MAQGPVYSIRPIGQDFREGMGGESFTETNRRLRERGESLAEDVMRLRMGRWSPWDMVFRWRVNGMNGIGGLPYLYSLTAFSTRGKPRPRGY